MEYPKSFKVSRRSPSMEEMQWLQEWIQNQKFKDGVKVLEFGCGITSWVLYNSFPSISKYVSVENYQPCMNQVRENVPEVEFIDTTWHDIPKDSYDFVFVDASTCAPDDLECVYKKGDVLFRDDAIHYSMDFVADDCYFVVHDWCYKTGWLRSRKYFDKRQYELIDCLRTAHGLGIYQKSKRIVGKD